MLRYHGKSSGIAALAVAGAFAASLLAGVSGAQADIIFTPGNNPQPDEHNIFFAAKDTGGTIFGQVGQPVGPAVQFESLTGETLNQNSKGQAKIENNAGGNLTSIGVSLPGFLFGDFILNLKGLNGDATIDVRDNLGNVATTTLTGGPGNGQNFLTITTANDELIANISVNAADGFEHFQQPRISGVCEVLT